MSAQTNLPPFPNPPDDHLLGQSAAQPTSSSIDAIIAQSLKDDSTNTGVPSQNAPIGTSHKETLPAPAPRYQESAPLVELHESETLPEEVESWLQKLDQAGDIKLPEPVTHDGEVLLADTEAQIVKEKIVLPMSQTGLHQGMQAKVYDSKRWLAEWCTRLIKIFHDSVKYAPETDNEL